MKVLMVNGSPNEHRNTARVLQEVRTTLEAEGVETETVWIGKNAIRGCVGCGGCGKNGDCRCVFDGDVVNTILEKAADADGFVFGSPVYFAGMAGQLKCVMDRVFYAGGPLFWGKPGAAVAVARRAGTVEAVDQMNKYFQISQMPVASSNYWNIAFGRTCPEEVEQDEEGLQTARLLAKQLVWMMRGLDPAELATEQKVRTNFSR